MSPSQKAKAERFLGPKDAAAYRKLGSYAGWRLGITAYAGWRLGITATGAWSDFIAGD